MSSDFNHPDSNDDSQTPYVLATERTDQADKPAKSPPQNPWAGKISLPGILAWLVVIAFTIFLCVGASLLTVSGGTVGGDASPMDLFPVQMQAKALIGQEAMQGLANQPTVIDESPEESFDEAEKGLVDNILEPPSLDGPTLAESAEDPALENALEAIDTGPYEQRLCTAIVISELKGPGEANDYLEKLDKKVASHKELELTENQKQLRETIGRLMDEYESGEFDPDFVTSEEKDLLAERLQWLGELALVPAGTSDESGRQKLLGQSTQLMIGAIVMMLIGILVLGAGLAVAIILLAFLSQGRLQAGFQTRNHNHNIYIETFAIWMILFFGTSIGLGFLNIKNVDTMMFIQPLVFFGSLVALVWPVVRGIPFSQVRQDIGWTFAKPTQDAGTSVLSYLSTLPLLIPAFALMFILMAVSTSFQETSEFARGSNPGHPIQEYVMTGNATMIALIFFAVCVCAPVVEETMFRGVLYRHLRELSGNWQRWASVLFAAILNGLIFAACHPQGIFGVPLLATLAVGFSLAREWRGSLVSPMIMHAIHNGTLTCIMLFIL